MLIKEAEAITKQCPFNLEVKCLASSCVAWEDEMMWDLPAPKNPMERFRWTIEKPSPVLVKTGKGVCRRLSNYNTGRPTASGPGWGRRYS